MGKTILVHPRWNPHLIMLCWLHHKNHYIVSVARLMGIKSQHNMSVECIDNLLRLFGDVLPEGHNMPSNLYECKCLLNDLKIPYVKIDACVDNYMLYYKQDEHKDRCDFCNENHYIGTEPAGQGRKRKPIPRNTA
jgi:regulator of sigma D